MNDRGKPPHYKSFSDFGKAANQKEAPPQEHNFSQLINWMSELKGAFSKLATDLADYRLQQARQLMEHREVVSNMVKDRKNIEQTMEMILQHLTTPGAVTVQGAVMPAEDAIALKVAELIKHIIPSGKSLQLAHGHPPLFMEDITSPSPSGQSDYAGTGQSGVMRLDTDAAHIITGKVAQPADEKVTEREQSGQNTPESDEIIPSGNIPVIPRKRIKGLEDKMIDVMRDNKGHSANSIYAALSTKYPDLDFHKPSIATGLSLMMHADKVKRLERGVYQLTIWGST